MRRKMRSDKIESALYCSTVGMHFWECLMHPYVVPSYYGYEMKYSALFIQGAKEGYLRTLFAYEK